MTASKRLVLAALAALAFGTAAAEVPTPDHAQTATEYRAEAAALTKQAAHHRQLAERYRGRGPGKVDGAQIARHCESLAASYDKAAQDATALADALSK